MPCETDFSRLSMSNSRTSLRCQDRAHSATGARRTKLTTHRVSPLVQTRNSSYKVQHDLYSSPKVQMDCLERKAADLESDPWLSNEPCDARRHSFGSTEALSVSSRSLKAFPNSQMFTPHRRSVPRLLCDMNSAAATTLQTTTDGTTNITTVMATLPVPLPFEVALGLAYFSLCLLYTLALLLVAQILKVPLIGKLASLSIIVIETFWKSSRNVQIFCLL